MTIMVKQIPLNVD